MHLLLSILVLTGQSLVGWDQLEQVEIKWEYVEEYDEELETPFFGSKLRRLDGKRIEISGYVVPADFNNKNVILSKQPYASCFFCGGAGIESIIEVELTGAADRFYEPDEILHVSGILQLNDTDYERLIFILLDAEEVK